jgi:hypothetical protein
MRTRNVDLWIILTLAAIGLAAQLLPVPNSLHIVGGLPLALFCPGYALVAAFFPNKTLGWIEQLLFSIGLSLGMAILTAVIFNDSPISLGAGLWLAVFGSVTVIASVAAMLRRGGGAGSETVPHRDRRFTIEQGILLGAAAFITLSAVVLARTPRPVTGVLGYTMLWMLPDDTPTDDAVHVGISSSELAHTDYRLRLMIDGKPAQDDIAISLAPGETWEGEMILPQGQSGEFVEAVLYRTSRPDSIYRHVTLWHYD